MFTMCGCVPLHGPSITHVPVYLYRKCELLSPSVHIYEVSNMLKCYFVCFHVGDAVHVVPFCTLVRVFVYDRDRDNIETKSQ